MVIRNTITKNIEHKYESLCYLALYTHLRLSSFHSDLEILINCNINLYNLLKVRKFEKNFILLFIILYAFSEYKYEKLFFGELATNSVK